MDPWIQCMAGCQRTPLLSLVDASLCCCQNTRWKESESSGYFLKILPPAEVLGSSLQGRVITPPLAWKLLIHSDAGWGARWHLPPTCAYLHHLRVQRFSSGRLNKLQTSTALPTDAQSSNWRGGTRHDAQWGCLGGA